MTKASNRTKLEVILDTWKETGSTTLGASEIALIQQQLGEIFGVNGVESPASIARLLADEGAVLRHPEILQVDSDWRAARLNSFFEAADLDFRTIDQALELALKISELTTQCRVEDDELRFQDLMETVRVIKSGLMAAGTDLSKEVVQWFTVLLQNPAIFGDWLQLRQNSPEFQRKFRS